MSLDIMAWAVIGFGMISASADVGVDLAGYRPDCGVEIRHEGQTLTVVWPMTNDEHGRLVLDLRAGSPLIASLGVRASADGAVTELVRRVDPVTFVSVGSRENPPGRPPEMSVFNVFFDSPAKRPFRQFRSELDVKQVRVTSRPGRATVAVGDLTIGPFAGTLEVTVYAGARLVHVEAVVSTQEERRAFLYDAGLTAAEPSWTSTAWVDTEGRLQHAAPEADMPRAVRYRMVVAETPGGSLACFPPPHQFFYPRDLTDNQRTVWAGKGHRGLEERQGFGIRQTETGGGNYVPWFNAPPGTRQRLGAFYLLTRGPAEKAVEEVKRYTHGDRYPDLPGHVTFASHWHMAIAVAAMREQAAGAGRTMPDFVKMFKDMNVRAVHLAEFHGDGHPRDPGPLRLPEMKAMFDECRRLSDDSLLFLPGEEANANLAKGQPPGQFTGHWLYLFPRPVYWTMTRARDQPFEESDPSFGTVYHAGNREDLVRLLERERGLAWTAHARIKASNWTPDSYRDEDFFRSPIWLGAAWKAMPADLSSPRLGQRVLDLLDDMANWGRKKYVLGEVDVFKIDHTHELFAHMNVNYLKLDRVPRYDEDWTPILDSLRHGRFFVSTGEVLLDEFTVGGQSSGSTLTLTGDSRPEVRLGLRWTFPLRFAELISGDGQRVYRERIELDDTPAFGTLRRTLRPDLKGRTWVRVEAWDVAANGVFSQPVWLGESP